MPAPKLPVLARGIISGLATLALGSLLLLPAYQKREPLPAAGPAARAASAAPQLVYAAQPIGNPMQGRPWIAHVCVVDLDGDGVPEIITGGFRAYPPWDHMSRITLWKRR